MRADDEVAGNNEEGHYKAHKPNDGEAIVGSLSLRWAAVSVSVSMHAWVRASVRAYPSDVEPFRDLGPLGEARHRHVVRRVVSQIQHSLQRREREREREKERGEGKRSGGEKGVQRKRVLRLIIVLLTFDYLLFLELLHVLLV